MPLTAPFSGRENDQAGIDFGIGRVSPRVTEFDRDSSLPARGAEELVEVTYQAQVTGWLVVQPDLQYVNNPGGGVLHPNDPTQKLRTEIIAGARTVVTF